MAHAVNTGTLYCRWGDHEWTREVTRGRKPLSCPDHSANTPEPEPQTFGCSGCSNRWTGLSTAHCATCHQTFSSVSGFDAHRVGGVCVAPEDVGLILSAKGYWRSPGPEFWQRTIE